MDRPARLFAGTRTPDVRPNVLPPVERHLKLRHDIPVRLRARDQIAIRQQFHHRRPHPSHACSCAEALAERRPPVDRARRRFACGSAVRIRACACKNELPAESARRTRSLRKPSRRCPKPLSRLPVGRMTSPCTLKIDPVRRLEASTRFQPEADIADPAQPPAGILREARTAPTLPSDSARRGGVRRPASLSSPGAPWAFTAVVSTVSSSGNAFSVMQRRAAGSVRRAAMLSPGRNCADTRSPGRSVAGVSAS